MIDVQNLEYPRHNLYALYEERITFTGVPFVCATDMDAIAQVRAYLTTDKSSVMAVQPEAYQLIKVGCFDAKTGVIVPCRDILCSLVDLVEVTNAESI